MFDIYPYPRLWSAMESSLNILVSVNLAFHTRCVCEDFLELNVMISFVLA